MDRFTIERLRSCAHTLGNSRSFAESLIAQYATPRGLSVKQQEWVRKLIERAERPTPVAAATGPDFTLNPDGVAVVDGWLQRMTDAGTLRPRLRYTAVSRNYALSRPGSNSLYAGQPVIFVRVDRAYAGRIQGGRFHPARDTTGDFSLVLAGLRTILSAPFEQAVATGHQTGNCCFCGRDLTDHRSVSRGYGPICADRLGLPWGNDGEVADTDPILPPVMASEIDAESRAIAAEEGGLDDEDRRFQ